MYSCWINTCFVTYKSNAGDDSSSTFLMFATSILQHVYGRFFARTTSVAIALFCFHCFANTVHNLSNRCSKVAWCWLPGEPIPWSFSLTLGCHQSVPPQRRSALTPPPSRSCLGHLLLSRWQSAPSWKKEAVGGRGCRKWLTLWGRMEREGGMRRERGRRIYRRKQELLNNYYEISTLAYFQN